jgi:hypothetical protein
VRVFYTSHYDSFCSFGHDLVSLPWSALNANNCQSRFWIIIVPPLDSTSNAFLMFLYRFQQIIIGLNLIIPRRSGLLQIGVPLLSGIGGFREAVVSLRALSFE